MYTPLQEVTGLGIDVVSLRHFEAFVCRYDDDELAEIFTKAELSAADRGSRVLYLATRWALKEAAMKALGTGWAKGVLWTDIEGVGELSAPYLCLHATAAQLAEECGASGILAHTVYTGNCVIGLVMIGPTATPIEHRDIE